MQLETLTQRKYFSKCCHAHSNAHEPDETAKQILLKNVLIFFKIYIWSCKFLPFTVTEGEEGVCAYGIFSWHLDTEFCILFLNEYLH